MTHSAPTNAPSTISPCFQFSFSRRKIHEQRIAKNGDILFRIDASDSAR